MIARIVGLVCSFVAAVLLVTIAVANRHSVRLVLDPFNPQQPVISAELPFYVYLFAMLIVGVIVGGMATWLNQGRWRRLARERTREMQRYKGETERLLRERDAAVAERKQQLALTRA